MTTMQRLALAHGNRYWAKQIGRKMWCIIDLPYDTSKGEVSQTKVILARVWAVVGESVQVMDPDGRSYLVDETGVDDDRVEMERQSVHINETRRIVAELHR